MNLKVFHNNERKSPFAPEWFYIIGEDYLDGVNFKKIAEIVLSKEKDIIEKFPPNPNSVDAYTGLGDKSLTARWESFNVLKWEEKEIQKLKQAIHEKYVKYLQMCAVQRQKVYVQCWANVMRKGEQITTHLHSIHEYTYLTGHVTVQAEGTETCYLNPFNQINDPDVYKQHNYPGTITFFPAYIPHYTTKHEGEKERITIAFDIFLKHHQFENLIVFDENI